MRHFLLLLVLPFALAGAQSAGTVALVFPTRPYIHNGVAQPGYDLAQIETAFTLLMKEGYTITLATPTGESWAVDPGMLTPESGLRLLARGPDHPVTTAKCAELPAWKFDGVIFTGGRSALVEYLEEPGVAHFLKQTLANNPVIGAIGHGAAAFLGVVKFEDANFLREKRITCFSDEEEREDGHADAIPYLLETAVRRAGAFYYKTTAHASNAIAEDWLVTGQNTESAAETVRAVIYALRLRAQPKEREGGRE